MELIFLLLYPAIKFLIRFKVLFMNMDYVERNIQDDAIKEFKERLNQ